MAYCLNPHCPNPHNSDTITKCVNCGTKLLLGDRYRPIRPIGQGGFGRTFLAQDEGIPSKPPCVIKQFFPQDQGTESIIKAKELFEREALRLDELGKHEQIPQLLAYFPQFEDNRQYLVQEFINGKNLLEEIETEGKFDENKIRQLLNEIVPILEFIHEKQVIHRDIKPENIIRRRGEKEQLVLVDFGASKVLNMNPNQRGTQIGSLGYVSPEQITGNARFVSDLYSLGMTCIHLMTQIHPFHILNSPQGIIIWKNYLDQGISMQLNYVLEKLIEIDMNRRYQTATEVLRDLGRSAIPPTILSINNQIEWIEEEIEWREIS